MNIDEIVPLLERVVGAPERQGEGHFFSYRHARELHALEVKHEFPADSPWTQVCASIVVSYLLTPTIWVRMLWSRRKLEYPTEECPAREFPLSQAGVRSFTAAWPAIRGRFAQAIARGHPPESAQHVR